MKYKIILLVTLFSSVSCGQLPVTSSLLNSAQLQNISNSVPLSQEDTAVNVYKSAISSTVSINVTASEKIRNRFVAVQGEGSGIIISKKGYILTNNHVTNNATTIKIQLSDNNKYDAKVVLSDPNFDIAIAKVDANLDKVNILPFGDSGSVQVGERVFAIGNPYGLAGTLTDGIVSSLNRDLTADDGSTLKGIIQTDAAINPGNSGGPLLNTKGEIIGINTGIFSPSGGNVGIGFAIPINNVKDVIRKSNLADLKS